MVWEGRGGERCISASSIDVVRYLTEFFCVLFLPHRVKSKEDALYELPEKLKVKSQLKQSEEMLSNQMLSGIPEVNLGIQAKIRNIEATEEAKMKIIEERRNKKNQGPSIMVPTNVAVDFMQHNRCEYMALIFRLWRKLISFPKIVAIGSFQKTSIPPPRRK